MSEQQAVNEVRALLSVREKIRAARAGDYQLPTLLELQALDRLLQAQQDAIGELHRDLTERRDLAVLELFKGGRSSRSALTVQ